MRTRSETPVVSKQYDADDADSPAPAHPVVASCATAQCDPRLQAPHGAAVSRHGDGHEHAEQLGLQEPQAALERHVELHDTPGAHEVNCTGNQYSGECLAAVPVGNLCDAGCS